MSAPRADIGAEAVRDAMAVLGDGLAAAVLRMALDDLEQPQRLCSGSNEAALNLEEAREFCFGRNPESSRARQFWCEAASVDMSYFQRLAAERCATSHSSPRRGDDPGKIRSGHA